MARSKNIEAEVAEKLAVALKGLTALHETIKEQEVEARTVMKLAKIPAHWFDAGGFPDIDELEKDEASVARAVLVATVANLSMFHAFLEEVLDDVNRESHTGVKVVSSNDLKDLPEEVKDAIMRGMKGEK